MVSIQLCILVWIFLTQTISFLAATPCSCNGFISKEGKGECETRHTGKLWCFVNSQAVCFDKKESKSISGKSWSFQACEDNIASVSENDDDQQTIISEDCICNGFISSEGKGECGTKFNEKFWCYVNSQAGCDDKKKSKAIVGQSWSFQACQENFDNAQLTTLDVDENGNIRCVDEGNCPDYDQNTMRNILGLTEDLNSYMSCMIPDPNEDDIKYKICILQYGTISDTGIDFDDLRIWRSQKFRVCSAAGCILKDTSPTTVQDTLFSPSRNCPRGTCRRGSRCCRMVYAGRNRGYICPYTC